MGTKFEILLPPIGPIIIINIFIIYLGNCLHLVYDRETPRLCLKDGSGNSSVMALIKYIVLSRKFCAG